MLRYSIYVCLLVAQLLPPCTNEVKADSRSEIDSLNQLAYSVFETKSDRAIEVANEAIQRAQACRYRKGEADGRVRLSNALLTQGKYIQSIEQYHMALTIRKELEDEKGIVECYTGLANVMVQYSRYMEPDTCQYWQNRARQVYVQAIELAQRNHYWDLGARAFNLLGIYYGVKGHFDSSTRLFRQALNTARKVPDTVEVIRAMVNLASTHQKAQRYDSGILWANEAMIWFGDSLYELRSVNYGTIGACYFMIAEDDSALKYYRLSERFANKGNHPVQQLMVYNNLASYFDFHNDYKQQSQYLLRARALSDSLNEATKIRAANVAQERFHTQELFSTNQTLEHRAALRKRNIMALAALLLLILCLGILLIYRSRQREQIALQSMQINQQRIDGLLQTQELKKIDAMLEGQETERRRIAADLHDRLGSILSSVKLHFTSMEDRLEELKAENKKHYSTASELLDSAASEVRRIAHDLASGTLVKFGLIPALYELKNTLEASNQLNIDMYHAGVEKRLEGVVEITLYRIIQEAISNILKHARATNVNLHLTQNQHELLVIIEDNGVGFDTNSVTHGLGMKNIKQRVQSLDGAIRFDSTKNRGTTVIIEIPIADK